ncbi:MAG: SDR family oxidoreductase [Bacteroidota bacterium]
MNKTAIVFGVRNERSIAFAVAKKLHESGIRTAVSYTADTKEDVLFYLQNAGMDPALTGEVNVQDESQIKAFVEKVAEHGGHIDYVLHSVAFGNHRVLCTKLPMSEEPATNYLDIPFEDLAEALDISAYSLLRICRVVKPHLSPNASILTMTYNASQRVVPAYAGMSVAKAALENIMKYLAYHFGQEGHRVNALSPGLLMTTSAAGITNVRTMRKKSKEASPLGNIKLEDVAEAAMYYFSDASKRVCGNIHYVDGGLNIMGID